MEVNNKRFRLSVYREHKVTGESPKWEFSFVRYRSMDHREEQANYSLKLGLLTLHLKWRGLKGGNNETD